jgi:large subunit ribosomal protein L23
MGIFGKKKNEEKDEAVKKDGKLADDSVKKVKKDEEKANKKDEKKASMKDLYSQSGAAGKEKKAKAQVKQERKYGSAYKILIKPLITEKAANLGALNKYIFEVDINANKIEVAKAVAEAYGVKPLDVNMIKNKGKEVRYGRRQGKRKNWKKAIVSLPKEQKINIYEGV